MSSENENDTSQLMAAFKKKQNGTAPPTRTRTRTRTHTRTPLSTRASSPPEQLRPLRLVAIRPSPVRNRHEYVYYEPTDEVETILREFSKRGDIMYDVRLSSGRTTQATFAQLIDLPGGSIALRSYNQYDDSSSAIADNSNMQLRNNATRSTNNGFVDISTINLSSSASDDELVSATRTTRARRGRPPGSRGRSSGRTTNHSTRKLHIELTSSDDDSEPRGKRRKRRTQPQEPSRRSTRQPAPRHRDSSENEDDDDDDPSETDSSGSDILRSDLFPGRKRKRSSRTSKPEKTRTPGVRQSGRATRAMYNMEEPDNDDMYRSDSTPKLAAPKVTVVREEFVTLPRSSLFRARHAEGCEVCYDGLQAGPLIYCQGCSLAYHKNCLGTRTTREHLVTKVGDHDFVLQCKRCVNHYKRKDATAPNLAQCQDCGHEGASCQAFRAKKTTQQEMKEREDNDGEDPVVDVQSELINNAHNVLFRCTKCSRAWHYHHLPPLSQYAMDIAREDDEMAAERFREYSGSWLCKECDESKELKIGGIVAWRPSDVESYIHGTPCEALSEDDKQYLIKWENQSYFQAVWASGAWTWGVAAPAMRKAFFKREQGPKMRTEDAIPEEFLRIDIVLDIKYTSYVEVRSEEIDKARIKEVDKALIKYKGLGYEDAVWEQVPTSEDGDRWIDFVTAYNDWVAGRYVKVPKTGPLKSRVEKARSTPFAKLERSSQPDNLVGGELMKYQIEGLNWLYYQWYTQKNGILADEMGLGKTIQVIGFMATLVQEHNCFPFLIVVPNSTCANWRREIKQWAPALRVVAYFGSSQARQMAHKYEMYPEGAKDLRCHIVVTSYEAAADDSCRRFFRGVNWAGLIIDEGQRLKNDKSQLYTALTAVKAPYRLLLTGTPLQNNTRELFNLLQFLDETVNAEELEERYAEMTSENIKELHAQIRPYILRRTKAQVLTFLPPLGQIILPISMSILQKQLYKSILSKSPQLLKALFTSDNLKQKERSNLNNILMQLRKCLCHPFVYSREIEERTDIAAVSHRNLVEASAKLHLLETLLPKLKERGHRVLIFSQFLDMLSIIEDFLDGMEMSYQRLDGTMGSLEKQKRIDQFNAPDSSLFAFLLSTRAGGVGINLATADTVIILDPDFNPHQDMQAIARAHRIGQKNKVLCFQLLTRGSVEEKIVQMGRKKMALDHVVVEQLDAEDDEQQDVESILKYGAAEIFKDDAEHEIRYDDASIDKLLDRSQIVNTKRGADDSAESQFSFARVWANDTGSLKDDLDVLEEDVAPDPGVWDKILKERQAAAAAEALAKAEALGRGRRARMNVDYEKDKGAAIDDGVDDGESVAAPSPAKTAVKNGRRRRDSDSDTDFQAESDEESEPKLEAVVDQHELDAAQVKPSTGLVALSSSNTGRPKAKMFDFDRGVPSLHSNASTLPSRPSPKKASQKGSHSKTPISSKKLATKAKPVVISLLDSPPASPSPRPSANTHTVKPFVRAQIPVRSPLAPPNTIYNNVSCPACGKLHPQGACELKVAGVEHCGLCGLAHFGQGRTCPHIRSETQVREMMLALKRSPESKELIDLAMKYLRGVKGTLVQQKKRDRERMEANAQGHAVGQSFVPQMTGPGAGVPRPLSGQYTSPYPPPVQHTPMYPGSVSVSTGSGSGSASGSAQHATAPPHHRPAPQLQQRFNEREAEVALQAFLKGSR